MEKFVIEHINKETNNKILININKPLTIIYGKNG